MALAAVTILTATLTTASLAPATAQDGDDIDSSRDRVPYEVSNGVSVEAPMYLARIVMDDSSLCTGTLIHRRYVVTAAHCVHEATEIDVTLGQTQVGNPNDGITIAATQWWSAQWDNTCPGVCNYDVGLIKLAHVVPDDWQVMPIYDLGDQPDIGDPLAYIGYGLTSPGGAVAPTPQMSPWGDYVYRGVCPGDLDRVQCLTAAGNSRSMQGDSGGPWFIDADAEFLFAVHAGSGSFGDEQLALGTSPYDVPWIFDYVTLPSYQPGTILRDAHQAQDNWLVSETGRRLPVESQADLDCLVGKGATIVSKPLSIISSLAAPHTGAATCVPDDHLPVPITSEDLGHAKNAGAVTVLTPLPGGTAPGSTLIHQGTPGVPGGTETGDQFGSALVAGDFNGDGLLDLAIGIPDEAFGSKPRVGAVQIMYRTTSGGYDPGPFLHQGTAGIPGANEAGDQWGAALAAGDLDHDGDDELVVGAPGEGLAGHRGAGAITLIPGAPSGLDAAAAQMYHQGSPGVPNGNEDRDQWGAAVAVSSHASTPFVAVGAPGEALGARNNAGSVTIFLANGLSLEADVPLLVQGAARKGLRPAIPGKAEPGDRFGAVLAADSNGLLAISSPNESLGSRHDVGTVTLVDGFDDVPSATTWHQNTRGVPNGNENGDRFGDALALAPVGPTSTLIVGAPHEGLAGKPDVGVVWVFPDAKATGAPAGVTTLHQNIAGVPGGNEAGDAFGNWLGLSELGRLAVGTPGEDLGPVSNAGTVTVFFGPVDHPRDGKVRSFNQDSGGVPDRREAGDAFGS